MNTRGGTHHADECWFSGHRLSREVFWCSDFLHHMLIRVRRGRSKVFITVIAQVIVGTRYALVTRTFEIAQVAGIATDTYVMSCRRDFPSFVVWGRGI